MTEPMTEAPGFYERPGLHVEAYDVLHRPDAVGAFAGDMEFYESLAAETGGPILELACGTGRVAFHLAGAGLEVVGLDRSEPMLAVARSKLDRDRGPSVLQPSFEHGDMTNFALDRNFALVIVAFRSFQLLLTPEAQRSCLSAIRRHLRPGGLAVLDVFDPILHLVAPDIAPEDLPLRRGSATLPNGSRVEADVIHRSHDPVIQVLRETWRFREVDQKGSVVREEQELLTMRWSYRFEMRHLFELSGLEVIDEFSDYQRSPPAYGHEQIWVVRRP